MQTRLCRTHARAGSRRGVDRETGPNFCTAPPQTPSWLNLVEPSRLVSASAAKNRRLLHRPLRSGRPAFISSITGGGGGTPPDLGPGELVPYPASVCFTRTQANCTAALISRVVKLPCCETCPRCKLLSRHLRGARVRGNSCTGPIVRLRAALPHLKRLRTGAPRGSRRWNITLP